MVCQILFSVWLLDMVTMSLPLSFPLHGFLWTKKIINTQIKIVSSLNFLGRVFLVSSGLSGNHVVLIIFLSYVSLKNNRISSVPNKETEIR